MRDVVKKEENARLEKTEETRDKGEKGRGKRKEGTRKKAEVSSEAVFFRRYVPMYCT